MSNAIKGYQPKESVPVSPKPPNIGPAAVYSSYKRILEDAKSDLYHENAQMVNCIELRRRIQSHIQGLHILITALSKMQAKV